VPPQDLDVWRIRAAGGQPERLTSHHAAVSYPTLLDDRTLVYIAPRADGSGAGLFVMDVEERTAHAASFGLEEYLSVAASADGKRLVASIANPLRSLWTAPITDRVLDDSGIARFSLPSVRVRAPRFGPDYVAYVSSRSGADGLWKLEDGVETELWKGSDGAVIAPPAVAPGGDRLAFVVRSGIRGRLHLIGSDGTGARPIAESLDVRDAPSWAPDGKWIAIAVTEGTAHPLYKVSLDAAAPVRLVEGKEEVVSDPVWSPDGRFVAYAEGRGTAQMRIRGVTPDGGSFPLPEVWVPHSGNRYRFLPDGRGLVVMRGSLGRQDFWLLELASGRLRRLTDLRARFEMRSFDVSPDGSQILFDRFQKNSDIVLIDLAR
jgi:Tol biopolymer transport system component